MRLAERVPRRAAARRRRRAYGRRRHAGACAYSAERSASRVVAHGYSQGTLRSITGCSKGCSVKGPETAKLNRSETRKTANVSPLRRFGLSPPSHSHCVLLRAYGGSAAYTYRAPRVDRCRSPSSARTTPRCRSRRSTTHGRSHGPANARVRAKHTHARTRIWIWIDRTRSRSRSLPPSLYMKVASYIHACAYM